jgi:hypothetical protein
MVRRSDETCHSLAPNPTAPATGEGVGVEVRAAHPDRGAVEALADGRMTDLFSLVRSKRQLEPAGGNSRDALHKECTRPSLHFE